MRLIFKKIKYKNILSTGNVFTEIFLDDAKTTLISGKNGAGKSTAIDALSFVLYGKSFRNINKPQLMNSINQKELLVEVEFFVGDDSYRVTRGIKPTVFEILKNGELLNVDAATRDYQAYLEKNILQMNFKSFTQVVILGSATYTPFINFTPSNRREIIEDLLDIKIFSKMNVMIKDRISKNKTELSELSHDIDMMKSRINSLKEKLQLFKKMKQSELSKIMEKISTIVKTIEDTKGKISENAQQTEILEAQISDKVSVVKKIDKMKSLRLDLQNKSSGINKELTFYADNDSCPTCTQKIEEKFKKITIEEKNNQKTELADAMQKIGDLIEAEVTRLNEISEIEREISKINSDTNSKNTEIRLAKEMIKSHRAEYENIEKGNEDQSEDEQKLSELEASLSEKNARAKQITEDREIYSISALAMKDEGIKTSIIRQYIPVMNSLINKYLEIFDLFVNFELDENFNETIKSRHRDTFTYSSFSEGEKMRINLSIMLSWREIAKQRNSISTNILWMDEVLDSASDEEGVSSLIHILNTLNASDNIFVISHRGVTFSDKFEKHLEFKKVKNFSQYDIMK
jgi:DNA repair exonuclease SbcCD ATPase subunit